MASQCSPEESRLVIHHLLAQCSKYLAVTRGIWHGPPTPREAEGDEAGASEAGDTRAVWEPS